MWWQTTLKQLMLLQSSSRRVHGTDNRMMWVTLLLQVAYKDKEVPVLSIEDALKREGRVSKLGWEEVAHI